jgi:D-alanyl-lipoteichoic acid acyltransferase DltB (MBOAT superfamily)
MITYFAGRMIATADNDKKAGWLLLSSILLLVFIWLALRHPWIVPKSIYLFPLGISFYSFQALSYLIDIYWGDEKPERNVWDFLIYMLFFMKFLSGPIERSGDFLPQIKGEKTFDYDIVSFGLKLIVIGLFKKVVIADNMAPYIDNMYAGMHTASGVQLLMTCLLYPIQLYTDFSGYTDIAIGGAAMFGLKLAPNFDRPFISKSTSELWRRWHMSLSFWVRDYVYIPLTSVTRRMGLTGISFSLIITFTALGLWHGAGWNFVVYGLIQGVIITYEMLTTGLHKRMANAMGQSFYNSVFIIRTYLLYAVSLVFFRAESLSDATYLISHISLQVNSKWNEINIGMPDRNTLVCSITFVLLMVFEHYNQDNNLIKVISKKPTAVRWIVYYIIVLILFIYGAFNTDTFVYLQF